MKGFSPRTAAEGALWRLLHPTVSAGLLRGHQPREDVRDLKGTLWAITSYCNPEGYSSRLENALHFSAHMKEMGIPVLCVEALVKNRSQRLPENAFDMIVRAETASILWQKEACLNVGVKSLPDDCDKVLLIDADILFVNRDLRDDLCLMLEKFAAVQPFSRLVRLPRNESAAIKRSALHDPESLVDFAESRHRRHPSSAARASTYGKLVLRMGQKYHGLGGGAWALRREVLDSIGIYDSMVFGSGDKINCLGYYGITGSPLWSRLSPKQRAHARIWMMHAGSCIDDSVSYLDETVLHLWHGDPDRRQHEERSAILKRWNFDPNGDVLKNVDGLWEWRSMNGEPRRWYDGYFQRRCEDG